MALAFAPVGSAHDALISEQPQYQPRRQEQKWFAWMRCVFVKLSFPPMLPHYHTAFTGPDSALPRSLLRLPLWTFDFNRNMLGWSKGALLQLAGGVVVKDVPRSELAMYLLVRAAGMDVQGRSSALFGR